MQEKRVKELSNIRKTGRGPSTIAEYSIPLQNDCVFSHLEKRYCSIKYVSSFIKRNYGSMVYNRFMSNLSREQYNTITFLSANLIDIDKPMNVRTSSVMIVFEL